MLGILKSIFQGLAAAVIQWYKAEQATANEWAARSREAQMKSMVDSLAEEKRINTIPVATTPVGMEPRTFTISDWNASAGELV